MMYFEAAGATHTGLCRETNEDRFLCDVENGLYVVADGVGGYAGGEVAARTAIDVIRRHLLHSLPQTGDDLRAAVGRANEEVLRLSVLDPSLSGMACVLTAVQIAGTTARVAHVGDTRLYVVDGKGIRKVTRDHSLVGLWEDAGVLTEEEAMHHPRRNEILRDVGSAIYDAPAIDEVDRVDVDLRPDEVMLLCSDGLTDLVRRDVLMRILRATSGEPQAAASLLIGAALDAGGIDNVTVVVVHARSEKDERRR